MTPAPSIRMRWPRSSWPWLPRELVIDTSRDWIG
jgi:hypothetical protein